MKKFAKIITKYRLFLNLVSISMQIRLTQALLDNTERELAAATAQYDLVKDFLPDCEVARKRQRLQTEMDAGCETLQIYRNQFQEAKRRLVA